MDDIFVARLMTTDLCTVSADTLVEAAANRMLENEVGSVVVVDDHNGLLGILTSTDFVRIVAEREPKDRTPVSEYMSTDVVTVVAQDPIQTAADRMLEQGCHHLPVVDETEGVIGMLSTTDITAYVSEVEPPTPE